MRLKVQSRLLRYFFPIGARITVRWYKATKHEEMTWQATVEAAPDKANAVLLRLADGKTQRLPPTEKSVFIDSIVRDCV